MNSSVHGSDHQSSNLSFSRRNSRRFRASIPATAVAAFFASVSPAFADAALVCEGGKLNLAAKYAICIYKAEGKALREAGAPDFTKCDNTLSVKWLKMETAAGAGVCPTENDGDDIASRITKHTDDIAILLSGSPIVECGNGIIDGTDQCEGSDLDGETCVSLGYSIGGTLACTAGCQFDTSGCSSQFFPATGQLTSYGAGTDGDLRAGVDLAYVDNHDGTITDANTGLVWEKKVSAIMPLADSYCVNELEHCANPHNVFNEYAWSATGTAFDGPVATIFLHQLNNRCDKSVAVACSSNADCAGVGGACGFAGHRDWRLPNIKELLSIADMGAGNGWLSTAFVADRVDPYHICTDITDPACSTDYGLWYWTNSTHPLQAGRAYWVGEGSGPVVDSQTKTVTYHARAVRGGF